MSTRDRGPEADSTLAVTTPPGDGHRSAGLGAGDRLGSYVVTGTMARGGCATVYAAEHEVLGRRVAVKVMHRELVHDPEMVARFLREARAVNLIGHPNIVDIHDIGSRPGIGPYFVMEYLEGHTVAHALRGGTGRFTPAEVVPILEPVGDALEAAHARGIVHRDLKVSNIFIAKRYGGETIIKLLDFGIAKLFGDAAGDVKLTTAQRRLGTPAYMAPEQFRGEAIDRRTDVYALGATVFLMLAGRPPFLAETAAQIERMHLEDDPPRLSQLTPLGGAIDDVLITAMAKRPADRYPTVRAFVEAFKAAVADAPRAAPEEPSLAVFGTAASPAGGELAALDFADALEDALGDGGFVIAMRAGASCLGVQPCPAAGTSERVRAVIRLARGAAAEHAGAATLFVRRGLAAISETGARGELLEYGRWVPVLTTPGVFVAEDLVELAGIEGTAPAGHGFRRLP